MSKKEVEKKEVKKEEPKVEKPDVIMIDGSEPVAKPVE